MSDIPCIERRGFHSHKRVRIGPTGRNKTWSVIADTCERCGIIQPIRRPLTYQMKDWVRRTNRRHHRKTP